MNGMRQILMASGRQNPTGIVHILMASVSIPWTEYDRFGWLPVVGILPGLYTFWWIPVRFRNWVTYIIFPVNGILQECDVDFYHDGIKQESNAVFYTVGLRVDSVNAESSNFMQWYVDRVSSIGDHSSAKMGQDSCLIETIWRQQKTLMSEIYKN